ncbi:MAG: hypothetical protein KME01_16770 [Chroococcus sp. CMT-3BRIN-NPC107]|jgi:hypothetical protein|nr:hypothetical protein [Chroococcus sp. CMT-3BRIN-NPC107]
MARYTCSFIVASGNNNSLRQSIKEILLSCSLDVIYDQNEYIMAREIPGRVSLAKLVSVEVLVDGTTATESQTRVSLVVKNEELPLQVANHCHQVFERVNSTISLNQNWKSIESIAI